MTIEAYVQKAYRDGASDIQKAGAGGGMMGRQSVMGHAKPFLQ